MPQLRIAAIKPVIISHQSFSKIAGTEEDDSNSALEIRCPQFLRMGFRGK